MAETVAQIDRWGIDPLTMQVFDDVDTSLVAKTLRIDASLEGNPQLISYKHYGTNAYWNLILIANGLVHPSELVAGMLIVLPQRRPRAPIKKVRRTEI